MGGRAPSERAYYHSGCTVPSAPQPSRLSLSTPACSPAHEQSHPRPGPARYRALPLLALVLMGLGLAATGPDSTPAAGAWADARLEDDWLADEMVKLVNQERAWAGLPELRHADDARDVAASRSLDMAAGGYFDHYSPAGIGPVQLLEERGVPFRVMAENIARSSFSPPEVVAIVHGQLMASESHRQNVLNPEFGRVGVAIASSNGEYYFAVEFLD